MCIYTILYIEEATNKNLLYSTGNSTQYSVMAYVGKDPKKKWMGNSLEVKWLRLSSFSAIGPGSILGQGN